MPSPFPGMDPFLEDAPHWAAFQHHFVSGLYHILLPSLVDRYRAIVEELERDLDDEATQLEAVPRVRALIARVVLTPRENRRKGGVNVEVVRHIDELLNLAASAEQLRA